MEPQGTQQIVEDEVTTTEGEPQEDTLPAPDGTEGEAEAQPEAEDQPSTEDSKTVKALRAEAAKWRTQLREAEKALSEAKTTDDLEQVKSDFAEKTAALEKELSDNRVALTKERLARKYNLPEELADRVVGSTDEELEADAKKLSGLVAPLSPGPFFGGLNPEQDGSSFDSINDKVSNILNNRNY